MVLTQLSKKQIILWRQGVWQKMQYVVIEQYPVCGMHCISYQKDILIAENSF